MAYIIFKTIKRSTQFNQSHRTFKERLEIIFIKNHVQAIKIRCLNSLLKSLSIVLYIIQVILSENKQDFNISNVNSTKNVIYWKNLVYFEYEPAIRYCQFVLACYGLFEFILYFYLYYNGKFFSQIVKPYVVIEFLCSILWMFEMFIPSAKNLFIPVFLNCWIVKLNLEFIFKDYNNLNIKNSISIIGQHLIGLVVLFVCLVMTSACGFEYFERASPKKRQTLFDSFYHTIITFCTVGYGDITPDYWLSKLFVSIMIIIAIIVIPTKIECLISLWLERKSTGGSYTVQRSTDKHIVLCLNDLEHDFILHFLKEFYGHRRNQATHTVLFTNTELNREVKQLLNSPLWHEKIYYIHGSALRESDLERAQLHHARAVFILSPRGCTDKDLEDQHTILRSCAVKDYAPNVSQFVQLFRTENKVHLHFVEHLICEDEFKYAILANNCLCPGISTLITLLMHKAAQKEKYNHLEDWQQLYGKLAGNEVHSICIAKSKFFHEFIGRSFPIAAYEAHRKYGVNLMAVASTDNKYKHKHSVAFTDGELDPISDLKESDESFSFQNYTIVINPGYGYEFSEDDICIYSSLVKEQNYKWSDIDEPEVITNDVLKGPDLTARAADCTIDSETHMPEARSYSFFCHEENDSPLLKEVPDSHVSESDHNIHINDSLITVQKPPNPLFFGCFTTKCKLLKLPNEICCLELNGYCKHKSNQQIQHKWNNKCIILAAQSASNGLLNFIAPLRGKFRTTKRIKPIVLLLNHKPSLEFLESICSFPLIYWCQGSISNVTSLLQAGILNCSALVVVSSETQDQLEEESLYDSSNIFAIENVYRFFPGVKIVTELRKASNIRFMKFRAKNMEREKYNKTTYMYKVPFTSGSVFSASMIDTLLYQSYSRPYLIEFVRLLIGIKQIEGSGNLTAIPLSASDMWIETYGNLFRKLAYTTGEIPIGIYRTVIKDGKYNQIQTSTECHQLVIEKMKKLKIDINKYERNVMNSNKISYVLINPPHDYELSCDDIVYVLQPGQLCSGAFKKPTIKFVIESET